MMTNRFVALTFVVLICTSSTHRAVGDTFGSGANTFDIEFVTIGNPGNPADTTGKPAPPYPTGSVAYRYRIGKYEISQGMINKANAEGLLGITMYDLTPHGGNGPHKPATGVNWLEMAKFVNWLNVSSGSHAAYKIDGGLFQLWTPSDPGYDPNNKYRNRLAKYVLPSTNEWYKAAYYDPTHAIYYDYPTGSNVAPTPVASGTAAGTAVYGFDFLPAGPADVTQAGGLSPFGTMGQGGNVWEAEETTYDLMNASPWALRAGRGSSWDGDFSDKLRSTYREFGDAAIEYTNVGFRVASIPEPDTLLLMTMTGIGLLWRRRSTG